MSRLLWEGRKRWGGITIVEGAYCHVGTDSKYSAYLILAVVDCEWLCMRGLEILQR